MMPAGGNAFVVKLEIFVMYYLRVGFLMQNNLNTTQQMTHVPHMQITFTLYDCLVILLFYSVCLLCPCVLSMQQKIQNED